MQGGVRGEECRGEGVMLRMVEGELVLTVLSRSTHPEEREEEEGWGEGERGGKGREREREGERVCILCME